jgi:arginine/ornithine N-succinyltransferase beta subunit
LLGDAIKVDHSELSLNGRAKNLEKSYVFSLNTVQALQVQGAPIIELWVAYH